MKEEINKWLDNYCDTLSLDKVNNIIQILNQNFGEENVEVPLTIDKEIFKNIVYNKYSIVGVSLDSIDYHPYITLEEVIKMLSEQNLEAQIIFIVTIKFPKITVSNELGASTILKNVFVRFKINALGQLDYKELTMNKSTYSYAHFINGYIHSHSMSYNANNFTGFSHCCLGSGPINYTMDKLCMEYDEDQWMQFCFDLEKYVTIESKAGIPYYSLERCASEYGTSSYYTKFITYGFSSVNPSFNSYMHKIYKKFIPYIIENKLIHFTWQDNKWVLADDLVTLTLNISSAILEWCKNHLDDPEVIGEYLKEDKLFISHYYYDHNFYLNMSQQEINTSDYEGKYILTFKNKIYTLEIEPRKNVLPKKVKIISPQILSDILIVLLYNLNINYYEQCK